MALDPQIPLSAAQQPSFAQQAGQVYQLAGAVEKQQEYQQQQQDQQHIQEALKGGANFNTPEGIAAAADQLKGKVSPKTYQILTQAHQEAKTNEVKMREQLTKLPEEVLKGEAMQTQAITQQLDVGIAQYKQDVKEVGQQEADRRYMEYKKTVIPQLAQKQAAPGQPLFAPQILEGYSKTTARQDETGITTMKWKQDQLDNESKRRLEAAQAEYYRKGKGAGAGAVPEEISKSTLHGQEFLALLSPGEAADVLAVAEGRKALSDIPARGGQRGRIGQFVTQFDPGFSNIRNPADKAAAVAISKDISAIRPYIDMLDKNAEIAVDLSKKVIATDSRIANRSINWVRQNLGDNPDVAEFLAQTTFVQTEAARVLNNPRLVGQLTDTARQEMEHVISGDMPMKSYERVIRRIQQDGQNRFQAMENQRNRLFGGSVSPKEVPQSEIKKPEQSTAVPHGTSDILSILKKHGVK